jgi:aspartate carbamoyltransferase catalytic subunit
MNRGVEIGQRRADGPHSVILDQVTNGVPCAWRYSTSAGGRPELAEAARDRGGRGGDA